LALIAGSIREFGFTNPVLIDGKNNIIAGHGRVSAARKLGMTEVPVLVLDHMTETQRKAYILADNQLAARAGWDKELLSLELGELKDSGFDLGLIGFEDIDALLARGTDGNTDPDDVPETPVTPVTEAGDVWVLGRHRLVCGDSTNADDVAKALNGVKPHLMVTDPPYGVNYDPDWRNRADRVDGKPYGARAVGKVKNDDRADWREAWALFPGDVAYVWHADVYSPVVADSLVACAFEMRALIVWAKDRLVIGRGHYHHSHEPCWYAVKKGGTGHWHGDRKQTTLWKIEHRKSETGHGTQKPVEAMRRPMENNSSPGQAVYEPFSGSGTTIIAAEMTGRACHAIELAPEYVDVAVKRWQDFTGTTATLEATGQTFAEVVAQRQPAADKAA
jgi:DNA modification methylase